MTGLALLAVSALGAMGVQDSNGYYIEDRMTAFGFGNDGAMYFGTHSGLIGVVDFPTEISERWSDSLIIYTAARFNNHVSNITVSPDGDSFTADQVHGDNGAPVYLFRYRSLNEVFFSGGYEGKAYFTKDSQAVFLQASDPYNDEQPMTYRKWSTEFGVPAMYERFEGDEELRALGVGAFGQIGETYLEVSGPSSSGNYKVVKTGSAWDDEAKVIGTWTKDSALAKERYFEYFRWSGTNCATRSNDKKHIKVFSILDGSLIRAIEHPHGIWYQEYELVGDKLLFAATERGEEIWDIETGKHLLTLRIVSSGRGAILFAMTPDGKYFSSDKQTGLKLGELFPNFDVEFVEDDKGVNQLALEIWRKTKARPSLK